MIIKSVEQLKRYLADGGDPETVQIELDPVGRIPKNIERIVYDKTVLQIYYVRDGNGGRMRRKVRFIKEG